MRCSEWRSGENAFSMGGVIVHSHSIGKCVLVNHCCWHTVGSISPSQQLTVTWQSHDWHVMFTLSAIWQPAWANSTPRDTFPESLDHLQGSHWNGLMLYVPTITIRLVHWDSKLKNIVAKVTFSVITSISSCLCWHQSCNEIIIEDYYTWLTNAIQHLYMFYIFVLPFIEGTIDCYDQG